MWVDPGRKENPHSKMKIGIVTWVTYNNYGTQLQAFALQKFLSSYGLDSEIIDDRPVVESKWLGNSEHASINKSKDDFGLKKIYKVYSYYLTKLKEKKYWQYYESIEKIEKFKNIEMDIFRDYNIESFSILNDRYDLFICGSDQIWSSNDIQSDIYYYLYFTSKPKIAYAPSLGKNKISNANIDLLCNLLRPFDAISVREQHNVLEIKEIYKKTVEYVCDPTILLTKDVWSEMCLNRNTVSGNYILCYFLEDKPWYYLYCEYIQKLLNIPCVLIPNHKDHIRKKICLSSSVDPFDFISLFQKAFFVLTDSYHGCIFSVLYNKEFRYLKRFEGSMTDSQNARIYSLLFELKISEQVVVNEKSFVSERNIINYTMVNERLTNFRKRSSEYLISNTIKCLEKSE